MSTEPVRAESSKTEPKVRPDEEVTEVLEMVKRYGPPVGIGFVVAIAVLLLISFRQQQQEGAVTEASRLFLNADSAEEFQRIVEEFADTPSGPMARLALAAQRYRDGMVEQARTQYSLFIERYPDHMMRPAAMLGLAYSDEALGQLESALQGFQSFQVAHPDHYLTSIARLSEARVLGLLGQIEAARAIYEQMSEDADPMWANQASNDLRYLEKSLRAAARAQNQAAEAEEQEL